MKKCSTDKGLRLLVLGVVLSITVACVGMVALAMDALFRPQPVEETPPQQMAPAVDAPLELSWPEPEPPKKHVSPFAAAEPT